MLNDCPVIRTIAVGCIFNKAPPGLCASKSVEPYAVGFDKTKRGQCLDGRHSHGLCDVEVRLPHSLKTEIILAVQLGIAAQPGIAAPAIAVEGQPAGQSLNRVGHFNILYVRTVIACLFRHSHTERGQQQLLAVPDTA